MSISSTLHNRDYIQIRYYTLTHIQKISTRVRVCIRVLQMYECFIILYHLDYIQTFYNDRRNTFHFACRQWYSYNNPGILT